jgi:hypothetical protein
VGVAVWIHIWVLYSVPLVFISVLVLVPCCFYGYGSLVYFEVEYCETSCIAFLAQYCLGYLQSFLFPNELQGRYFNLGNSVLMGIVLKMQISFGSIAIFTMLILTIHEHGRSFHLLQTSLIPVLSSL